jgi:hypothetical protein
MSIYPSDAASSIGPVTEGGKRWLRWGYGRSDCSRCPLEIPCWPWKEFRKFLTAAAASGADEEAL